MRCGALDRPAIQCGWATSLSEPPRRLGCHPACQRTTGWGVITCPSTCPRRARRADDCTVLWLPHRQTRHAIQLTLTIRRARVMAQGWGGARGGAGKQGVASMGTGRLAASSSTQSHTLSLSSVSNCREPPQRHGRRRGRRRHRRRAKPHTHATHRRSCTTIGHHHHQRRSRISTECHKDPLLGATAAGGWGGYGAAEPGTTPGPCALLLVRVWRGAPPPLPSPQFMHRGARYTRARRGTLSTPTTPRAG